MQSTNIHTFEAANEGHGCSSSPEAVIVGLYGIPGSGKSFHLELLMRGLDKTRFDFYDGSQVISDVTPGGLEAFQGSSEESKCEYRERAINQIRERAYESGKAAIVAGHAMFWGEGEDVGQWVCTPADLQCYTHIVYLHVTPETVAGYRRQDRKKRRPDVSIAHLRKWQNAEMEELRRACRIHGILFSSFSPRRDDSRKLILLLEDFHWHSEELNTKLAKKQVDEILGAGPQMPETVLLFDADKTLASQDGGSLFWSELPQSTTREGATCPLKDLFAGPLQYSYRSFRQATLLCEEAVCDRQHAQHCEKVASLIKMHQQLVYILRLIQGHPHIRAIVLTCGIRGIWEMVLQKENLATGVSVIGGGRLSDAIVMTPALKEELVRHIRKTHGSYVWAFGDSPLDLGMLKAAHQAVVVTGEKSSRSHSMDKELAALLQADGFYPRQVVLPAHAAPRLDPSRLPLIQLSEQFIMDEIFTRWNQLHVVDASHRPSAKILMTPMRDAAVFGPALRDAHRRVGWYLATEHCTGIMGVETFTIRHVQGHPTDGHRILHEKETLIVALMRGGEPMALGVSEALPTATFLHAQEPRDISPEYLVNVKTVVLVDSVVNSGKSILDFVRHIRTCHATVRVLVVAGVIQSQSVTTSSIAQEFRRFRHLSFIALRLSENKFTGSGGTDTGNRLFNTTTLS